MKVYTKDEAKKAIGDKVGSFGKYIDEYKLELNETQTERNWIEPFFECLNWNVRNEGLPPSRSVFQSQQVVSYEDENQQNSDHKNLIRPDMTLRVEDTSTNSMRVALIIEAKKPKENLLDNIKYYNQVYKYAWNTQSTTSPGSKHVNYALLTDFEEFILFDCQDYQPLKTNKLGDYKKRIIINWTYKDYYDKFDELWELLEYNNVQRGSLDKKSLTPKDLAEKRERPDKLFLNQLKEWRIDVARNLYKNDNLLEDYQLTQASLVFINRTIFIKMLADRSFEEDYLSDFISKISGSKKQSVSLYSLCKGLFERLNNIYNGSLFEKNTYLDDALIDNSVLLKIFAGLKPDVSNTNLSAMPVEIIGDIYELIIAEQIQKRAGKINIVSKFDEKKAGGVYYTPRYIVEYIVEHTIGEKLKEYENADELPNLKIIDPACGSGSFLITAYQKLLDFHKDWIYRKLQEVKNTKSKKGLDSLYELLRTQNRTKNFDVENPNDISLTHKLKARILSESIYGVDIDPQAVLVTQFSLSLKMLEDSTKEEIRTDYDLYKMPILPNLKNNIKWGNSLIGSDFLDLPRPSLFNEKEKRKIKVFDWDGEDGFPEIMKSGGFDIVIGNPPYVKITNLEFPNYEYYSKYYSVATKQVDLYSLFFEKGALLTKLSGMLSFIVPRFVQFNLETIKVRELLLKNIIYKITEVGMPFQSANTECVIISIMKGYNENNQIEICDYLPNTKLSKRKYLLQKDFLSYPSKIFNTIVSPDDMKIINKLGQYPKVKEVAKTKRGMEIGKSAIRSMSKGVKTLLGEDVNKYRIDYQDTFCEKKNKEVVRLASVSLVNKLLIRRVSNVLVATLDTNGYYFIKNLYSLQSDKFDLKYLLGIINSKLINYYFKKYFTTKKEDIFPEIQSYHIDSLPVKPVDFTKLSEKKIHDKLVSLVEKMLMLNNELQSTVSSIQKEKLTEKISVADSQIDRLVYQLYGLTEEEIATVEKFSNK